MPDIEVYAPTTHNIYFTPYGETYSPPLSGVISLGASSAAYSSVSISLVRFITISTKSSPLRQIVRRKQQPPASYTETVAYSEVLRPTSPFSNVQEGQAPSFEFTLAVPAFLCSTTYTPIATISYALTVHAKTDEDQALERLQDLHICRAMVPSTPLVFEHLRRFQQMPFRTRLFLSPEHLSDLAPSTSFNGTILLEGPLVQRRRSSEINVAVIREVRWSVAEAIEVSQTGYPSPPDAEKRFMRTICEGKMTGNWMPDDLSLENDTESLARTEVPLRVLAQKATSDMTLLCPHTPSYKPACIQICAQEAPQEGQIAISVSHRLRLEIVVDRKSVV